MFANDSKTGMDQTCTVESLEAESMKFSVGSIVRTVTACKCACVVETCRPLAISHRKILPSVVPRTNTASSQASAIDVMRSVKGTIASWVPFSRE